MAKKTRNGNREPRKPKQPKPPQATLGDVASLMKSRAGAPTGAK
jgi:hypothetical protein